MPRAKITSRPLIKDTDPRYLVYKREYARAHKAEFDITSKAYYQLNKEKIKARRRERYHASKEIVKNVIDIVH
jgi:hypothetical protein